MADLNTTATSSSDYTADLDNKTVPSNFAGQSEQDEQDQKLFESFQEDFRQARDHSHDWREHVREANDYVAGEQWSQEDAAALREALRPIFTFNRIAPMVKIISGLETGNRKEVRYIPRRLGATGVNDLLTGAGKWCRDECDAEDEESDAFVDCIIGGMGWCLSGDAMVRLPNSHFATTRLYSGTVIEIDLENGKKLTGTPNHPVLTDKGWKRLYALEEGDNLVGSAFLERIKGLPVEQFDQVEARLEDKINAFRAGRKALRLVTAPDDFYTDGVGSKVHIVYADRALLGQIRYAAFCQQFQKRLLRLRKAFASARIALLGEGLNSGSCYATIGQAPLDIGHTPSPHIASGNVVAERVAGAPQSVAHRFFVEPDASTDFDAGQQVVEIQGSEDFDIHARLAASSCARPELVSCSKQPVGDVGTRYSNLIADFVDWKPALEIEARNFFGRDGALSQFVTGVKRRVVRYVKDFAVHDIGTSLGFFIAGDIITSNTETRLDYDEDPDGRLYIDRMDPMEMYWDALARKKNLADARVLFRVKDVSPTIAHDMFPGVDLSELHAEWAVDIAADAHSPHDAQQAPFYRNDQSQKVDRELASIRLVEVQWWEHETVWRVLDPMTRKETTLDEGSYQIFLHRLQQMAGAMGQQMTPPLAVKIRQRHYYRAFLGSRIIEKWDGPAKGGFTWKCFTGDRDRNKGTFYGCVKAMIDPQKWANKWMSQSAHILNSNAKGGIMAETDAFEDFQDAEDKWAEPDSIIEMASGALSGPGGPKVVPRQPPPFPTQLTALLQLAISSIRDCSGVNLELLGMVEQDQPGVVEQMRKKAGMTVLSSLFDSLRRYRKDQGRLMLWYIVNFLSDGRLIKIGDDDSSQYVPLVRQPDTVTYDVIVDETPTSPNAKEETWGALIQMMPFLSRLQIPPQVYVELMKYSPLPATLTSKISGILQQAQQHQQQQPPPQLLIAQEKAKEIQARTQLIGVQAQKTQIEAQQGNQQAQAENARSVIDAHRAMTEQEEARAHIESLRAAALANLMKAGITQQDTHTDQFLAVLEMLDKVVGWHQNAQQMQSSQNQQAQQMQADAVQNAQQNDLANRQHDLAVEQANQPQPGQ